LLSIKSIRVAVSELTTELRAKAIANAKHELVAFRLEALSKGLGDGWMSEPQNAAFVQGIAKTSGERFEASYELSQTSKRYVEHNDVKLSVAEQIGKLIWLSIQDKKFEGVQTAEGILKQVRDQALERGLRGAKDLDVLRGTWKTYRGVVHLGMAIDHCEESPDPKQNVLHVAESFRRCLSLNCPKGTQKPYVAQDSQIKFEYLSMIWGPRFRDRGLPFAIN
jgi:hypothetical protein